MGTTEGRDLGAYDVVMVGGGAAGLNGALTLGRAPRSVLVVDAGFLAALGLRPAEHPAGAGEYIHSDATGRTDVLGVWVAGNVTDLAAQVGAAASSGAAAAAQINADLVAEDTERAVTAYRARHEARTAGRR